MRKETFRYIEALLYYHDENKKMLHEMEKDIILTNKNNNDENVGGGKSNVIISKIENIIIKLDSDKKLYNMRENIKIVDEVLDHVSEPYKKLIHMKYFSKKKYSWLQICEVLHVGRRTAFRMRKKVIEEIADRLGLV